MATRRGRSRGRKQPRRARSLVRVGSAFANASDLRGLRRAFRNRKLVLFLGAGVSMPYGIPSWKNLVLELLFEQAQGTRKLGRMWPHYRRAVASWMTDYFDYNPLVLARMVERDLRHRTSKRARGAEGLDPFLQRLSKYLYANYRRPRGRTALGAIADLIARRDARRGIDAVVTFNFDDLLERELRLRRVPVQSIAGGHRQEQEGLRVIHVHGFLPRTGATSRRDIVFTETDYHRLTESVFHWSLTEIVELLRKKTVLFIGLSMADPSLRRLLDASRNSTIPPHWQIQKRHEIRDQELAQAMAEVEHRAQKYATLLGFGVGQTKAPAALEESIHAALHQADSYDREVYESMGVKTIWVSSFTEIADIVSAIAER